MSYPEAIASGDGVLYAARACGSEMPDGLWQGWIEFEPVAGGAPLRSARETTQPNRTDAYYWATGLTAVYLEGALHRALHPLQARRADDTRPPLFGQPAPRFAAAPAAEAVLDPFSVYQKGETLLRRQLAALSSWHLVNIINAHQIATGGRDPNQLSPSSLIEAIVGAVKQRAGWPLAGWT
jgi:hypothetical protein